MTPLFATLTFALGAIIGSFLSVAIYRIHMRKKGILISRSFCPACKKKIKFRHLIPIFSWLFLRGKCAYCGKKISAHYIMLEIVTGLLFLATFFMWNFIETVPSIINPSVVDYTINWQTFEIFIFYIIEFSMLSGIFFYDLMYKIIPDRFSLPAIAVALTGGLVIGTLPPLDMLIGGAAILAFFALQFFASKGKWIGGGDLRLGLLIGVLLGWKLGIVALVVAYILGAIISGILLIMKKVGRRSAIPFGPFLVTGMIAAIFFGDKLLEWYMNSFSI
ncbi:MAG: prepilin peptidase [Candidatus Peregrinibacteria bacterium]